MLKVNTPDGWTVKKLKDTGEAIIGLTYSPSDVVESGGIVVLRSSNVKNSRIVLDDLVSVSSKIPQKIILREGDILVCARNGSRRLIGKNAYINSTDAGKTFGAFMCVFRSRKSDYMFWLFQTESFRKQVARDLGPTINQVTTGNLNSFQFMFPDNEEQTRIVTVLKTWNSYIEKLDMKIKLKTDIKRYLLRALLTGQKRLHPFTDEWENTKLGEVIAKIEGGGTPSKDKAEYWNGELPWASVKDIVTHNPSSTKDTITQDGLRQSSSKLIPRGTLITSTRMALGCAVFFDIDVAINQDLKALYPKKDLLSKYLYYWFELNKRNIQILGTGSTVSGIQLSDLKRIKFSLPKIDEQSAIVNLLSTSDSEISHLKSIREIISNQRKYLTDGLTSANVRTPHNLKTPKEETDYA